MADVPALAPAALIAPHSLPEPSERDQGRHSGGLINIALLARAGVAAETALAGHLGQPPVLGDEEVHPQISTSCPEQEPSGPTWANLENSYTRSPTMIRSPLMGSASSSLMW